MQLSITLVQSLEELIQTAITRLTAEIKTESNPQRLDTLLTLAFRARLPRIPAPPSPRTSPTPQSGRAFGSTAHEGRKSPGDAQHQSTSSRVSSRETGRANGAELQKPEVDKPRAVGAKHHEPEVTQPGLQDRHQNPPPQLPPRDSSLVPHTSSPLPSPSPPDVEDEDDLATEAAPTNEPLPHYLTPMTEDEFAKLQREIGHTEANRRRLIRAHLAANHSQRTTDSS